MVLSSLQHLNGLWLQADPVACALNVPKKTKFDPAPSPNAGACMFLKDSSVPWVAGHGAAVCQVVAGVGVDTGAQPLAAALVPGVQHVHHFIAAHAQGAAVRLAGDIEVDPYVEGVARSQSAVRQAPLKSSEGWSRTHTHTHTRFNFLHISFYHFNWTQQEDWSSGVFLKILSLIVKNKVRIQMLFFHSGPDPLTDICKLDKNGTYSQSWLYSAAWLVRSSAAASNGLLPVCWYPMKCFGSPRVCIPQAAQPITAQDRSQRLKLACFMSNFDIFADKSCDYRLRSWGEQARKTKWVQHV